MGTVKVGRMGHNKGRIVGAVADHWRKRLKNKHPDTVAADVEACRDNLKAFVSRAWPLIDPSPFSDNWHIGAICDHLDAVRRREIKRLIINVPPGSSKTSIASVLWPAHVWTEHPDWAWIAASYSGKLSTRDARRHRDVVSLDWFKDRWPGGTVEDTSRIAHFQNISGGWRLSTTPGSDATGYHADGHIVDDPLKPRDARDIKGRELRAKLEEIVEWWANTMSTRAKRIDELTRVIIMQRLHDRDLAGAMLEEGGYEHLCLPMEYNPKILCETSLGRPDKRTKEGELLDPIRFPRDAVDQLKIDLKDAAAAQLDQSPVTPGGGLFKEAYFRKRFDPDKVDGLVLVTSWDMRFKDDTERGSYVVGSVWGYHPGEPFLYKLDQVRGRWSYSQTKTEFKALSDKWPLAMVHLIENKANGPAIVSDLEGEGYNMQLIDATGSKESRANLAEPHYKAGCVLFPIGDYAVLPSASKPGGELPRGPDWLDESVREHVRFPRYSTDDIVDADSQAITWIHSSGSDVGTYIAGVKAAAKGR